MNKSEIIYTFSPNKIYCGNNLTVVKDFPEESVDLIYIDPPFFSDRNYEIIWEDGYEIRSFEDRWEGGLNHYIEWMRSRIEQFHRILKDVGTFYMHCDYHASHHLKVMCDEIFGEENFLSEIVWRTKYQSATISSNTRSYGNNHNVILVYVKNKKARYIFNRVLIEIEVDPKKYQKDEFGKHFKSAPADNKGQYCAETLQRMLRENRAYKTRTGRIRTKKYLTEKNGKLYDYRVLDNIWMDIPNMMHVPKKERLGYPTQKPEALLERIIEVSSNPDDIVFDGFCGCGTTIAVAKRLGRKWIGIDVSPTACRLMAKRIKYKSSEIFGMKYTIEELKKLSWIEFQNWVLERIGGKVNPKKTADGGIDGRVPIHHLGANLPVEVKQHQVSRPDVDKFETVLRREKKKAGIMVGLGVGNRKPFSKRAIEEIARFKKEDKKDIVMISANDLIEQNEREKSDS